MAAAVSKNVSLDQQKSEPAKNITLLFGNHKIYELAKRILLDSEIELKHEVLSIYQGIPWNRDGFVILLSGDLLFPRYVDSAMIDVLGTVTGIIQKRFCLAQCMFSGNGLLSPYGLPSCMPEQGKRICAPLAIEGGNVKYFRFDKVVGAIIGASSLIFSSLRLEREQLFPTYVMELLKTSPLEASDAAYDFVCATIAQALQIDKKYLVVLEHLSLHIDLEVSIGPNRKVFLHDPILTQLALERAETESRSFFGKKSCCFTMASFLNAKHIESKIFIRNREKLASIEGCPIEVIGVPGLFDLSGDGIGGQLLNGIMFHDFESTKTFFLTTAAPGEDESNCSFSHLLVEPFSEIMKQHQISVIYLDCGNSRGGGLHCMSSEIRKNELVSSPHLIPIHSQSFSTRIPTKLQLKNCSSSGVVLNVTDPVLKTTVQIAVSPRSVDNNVDFEVPVPADGNLEYHLSGTMTTVDYQVRRILPGQSQVFYAAPLRESPPPNATWIKLSSIIDS